MNYTTIKSKELIINVKKGNFNRDFSVKQWGDGDGDHWLLLHGWLDNANSFDILAPLLLQKLNIKSTLICMDMAGHGLSSHKPEGVYHLIDYASDAILIVEALQWNNFNIIGHSLGQSIASLLAASYPDRIKHLVLLEGIGPSTDQPEDFPAVFRRSMDQYLSPDKEKKIYETKKHAIQRRVEGNAVGTLSYDAAKKLTLRGTIINKENNENNDNSNDKVLLSQHSKFTVWEINNNYSNNENDGPVSWSFDDGLKLTSRLRFTESVITSFFKQIKCPTLVFLAKDGLLSRRGAKPYVITTLYGRLLTKFMYSIFWSLSKLPLIGKRFEKMTKFARLGIYLGNRYASLSKGSTIILPSGGHHPHLNEKEANIIATDISKWYNNNK